VTSGSLLGRLAEDGRGGFRLGEARFLLIRPETLIGLQKALERALGAGAADCFAEGGRAGGARAMPTLAGGAEERAQALARMGAELGWGIFTVETMTPTTLVITVANSPFAEAHGRAPEPVCHLTRGVLEALAENIFGGRVSVRETHCEAAGASHCRFEARA
jgi:predicted hydrocarbon binding protein